LPGTGASSDYIEYFLFFPLFYTSIYWLEEVGHYQTVMYAMVFQTVSLLIAKAARDDSLGQQSTAQDAVAQALNAIAQVYLYNGITKFTGCWFGTKERSVATGVILVSAALGQYTPSWISYTWLNYNQKHPLNPSTEDLGTIMDRFKLVMFLLNLGLTVLIMFFFDSKP
jgi:hypothetical protein